nr:T-complex protein 1 subunit eta [Tanacetum cinerariifolium]
MRSLSSTQYSYLNNSGIYCSDSWRYRHKRHQLALLLVYGLLIWITSQFMCYRFLGLVRFLKKNKLEMNDLIYLADILQFNEKAKRSLHDAIMIVRKAMKNCTVVVAGGATNHARNIAGKSQLFINAFAKALEVGEGALYGVDINTGGICDSFANFVWEPAVVKINAINAVTEASCLILSVDETVKNPK